MRASGARTNEVDLYTRRMPDRRSTTWRRGAAWAILVILTGLPILTGVWHQARVGWYPESDNATIALLSGDTFSRHPPLLGMISTGGTALENPELHHPGPLELYLLAPLSWVTKNPGAGATVTVALLNLASLAVLALAVRAIGGKCLAAGALVAGALALWGLGSDVPVSVWNPYVVALPFASFFALVVATVSVRRSMLPWALVVGSFVAQTHLSYVGTVGLLMGWALGATAWHMVRDRSDPTVRRADRRIVAQSVAAIAVVWAPPVIQQLTGQPGNLGQILRSIVGGGGATVGPRALGEFGRVVGIPILGLRPRADLVRVLEPLSGPMAVAFLLPWLALGVIGVIAWRRGQRTVLGILATVGVALLGGALTATRMPLADGVLYQYYALWMWPLGAVSWLLIGWCCWQLIAKSQTSDGTPLATSGPRPWLAHRPGISLVAMVVMLSVVSGLPRPGAWAPWVAYRRIASTVVPDVVEALPRPGRYLVRFRGATAYLSTGSAVVLGVEHAGSAALIDPAVPTPVFPWAERRRYVDQSVDGELWVVSGRTPADLPSGARLVAASPTLTPAEHHDQAHVFEDLLALVRTEGLTPGPRSVTTPEDQDRVEAALNAPEVALASGDLANLASQGLVQAPDRDLARLVAAARLRTLADEHSVRVYLVQRS